jgi:hypothetical protein
MLAERVYQLSPKIQRVIRHDIAQYSQYEVGEEVTEEESDLYADGIQAGYDFIVGCFTFIYFLRSHYDDIESYLSHIPNRIGELPVSDKNQLDRIKSCRSAQRGGVNSEQNEAEDTAHELAGDYFFEAPAVAEYITEDLALEGEEPDAFDQGYYHGVAQAILMYVLSKEESVLRHYDNPSA